MTLHDSHPGGAADPALAVQGLRYGEARAALELTLTALQSDDLEVEEMSRLHRQATAYADHCSAILSSVEQSIVQLSAEELVDAPNVSDAS